MEGALHLITWFTHRFFMDGTVLKPGVSWAQGAYPHYGVYKTKDGKLLSIGCLEPHFWDNLCKAIGREDYMPHKWSMEMTFQGPEPKFDEIRAGLEKIFLTKTRDEWFDQLAAVDVPVGKVYSLDETFRDPQILHRKMVIELDHPKLGKVKQVGILPKLSDTPGQVRRFAPVHGEHTDEILGGLGFSAEDIGRLRKDGTVG